MKPGTLFAESSYNNKIWQLIKFVNNYESIVDIHGHQGCR